MPFYDLRCGSCNKESNINATIAEKTQGLISCPSCGSTNMKTTYNKAPFVSKGSHEKQQACPRSSMCGSSCPHTIAH